MWILAHRGAHHPDTAGVAENSLDAFRAAADLGADGVELDVRCCADGVLVVHHDPVLGDGRPIGGLPATALPPGIPTLAAALGACASMALVDIEVKSSPLEPAFDPTHMPATRTAAAVARRWAGSTLISSFNLGALGACRLAAPAVSTGWLTGGGYDQLAAVATAAAGGHRAICPPEAVVTPELVATARLAGLAVLPWVVDDPGRMEAFALMGVEGIITDRPGLALCVLR